MKTNVVVLILLAAVLAFAAAGYLVLKDHLALRQPPVVAQSVPFELRDQNDQVFASSSLKGKVWIANFFFTSCEGICPTINGAVARFAAKVKDSGVQFVSISVDPKHDTPAVLQEYAKRFKADPARWHFLTGPDEVVSQILASVKLGSTEDPTQHTSRLVLLDGQGQVRGYYQGTDDQAFEFLERDLKTLQQAR